MRIRLIGSLLTAVALAAPSSAIAGNLGKVTKAVSNKTSSGGGGNGSSSGGSDTSRDHRDTHVHYDYHPGYYTCTYNCGVVTYGGTQANNPRVLAPQIDLGFAIHSVDDSDGAAVMSIMVSQGGFGVGIDDTSYFERLPLPDGSSDRIRMDLFSIHLAGRIAHTPETQMWVTGGVGGAHSNQFDALHGPTLGLSIDHHLGGALSVQGSARLFFLEKDVDAREYRAGVKASVVTLGYRHVEFNVGPPLKGPELGVQLSF